jgi:hypothetical protein
MKFVFLLGGAGGFLTAAATDYLSDRTPDRILLDGAVGCLVGAFLFKWFWNVLLRGIHETYVARHQVAHAPAPVVPAPIPAAAPAARSATPALSPVKTR